MQYTWRLFKKNHTEIYLTVFRCFGFVNKFPVILLLFVSISFEIYKPRCSCTKHVAGFSIISQCFYKYSESNYKPNSY